MKFQNFKGNGLTTKQRHVHSPTVDSVMREVLHTLGNIDFQHEVELDRIETSSSDDELKDFVRNKILARHHERREPYVKLLFELRKQRQRLAVAA